MEKLGNYWISGFRVEGLGKDRDNQKDPFLPFLLSRGRLAQ